MTVWLGPTRPTRCHMAALSRNFRRLRDDYPGGRGGDVVRKKTGWVIGLFAALAISILLVDSLGYSLVFQEEPAPLGTNRAARPTAPSSTAAAPSAPAATPAPAPLAPTTPAPAVAAAPSPTTSPVTTTTPPAPKSPPAVAASLIPPTPSVVTPSGPQATPPATPPAPAAAAPLAIQRLAGPTVPPAPTTAAPAAALPTAMPAEAAMSAADRRQGQAALLRLGYDPGPEDGLFGPQTRAAIRRFQQSVGAEPTGIITADQASRLVSMPTPTTSQ